MEDIADIGSIKASLELNARGFTRSIEKAKNETSDLEKKLGKVGARSKLVEQDMKRLGGAFIALNAAMAATVGMAVKVSAQFEQSMSRVKAVTGATEAEFSRLEETASKLGATTIYSASQVADGMNFLAMAGFKTNEIISAMPGVLDLAAAGQMDLATTSDIASNILTGFGLSASETSRVVDVMAKTMTNANTNIPQLGDAMKYVAPIATQAGLSLEETAAAVGKLSDAGIQGQMAGTSLRAILVRLIDPPKEAADAMDKLGLKTRDLNGELLSLPDIIANAEKVMSGMTNAQKAQYASMIAGTEAASGFLTLLSNGSDVLTGFTNDLQNAGGTAKEIADAQMDTLNGAIKELQSSLEAVGITVGDKFAPAIREAAEGLTSMALGFENLDSPTQNAILAFVTMGTVAGTATTAIYGMITAMRMLSMSIPLVGAITVAVGALAAAYAYASTESENTTEKSEALRSELVRLDGTLQDNTKSSEELADAKDEMAAVLENLREIMPNVVTEYENEGRSVEWLTGKIRENTFARMENLRARYKEALEEQKKLASLDRSPTDSILGDAKKMAVDTRVKEIEKEMRELDSILNGNASKTWNDYKFGTGGSKPPKRVSAGGGGSVTASKSSGGGKSPEDIAREQYQASLKWVSYKKSLNQLSEAEELAAYNRLSERYKKYTDIRRELETKTYQVKTQMAQNSFEDSIDWIEAEERRMREAGATDEEVAQMRLDAWTRLKTRYKDDAEKLKQIDRELYRSRTDLIDTLERDLNELAHKTTETIRNSEREELNSLDRRKRELQEYYDEKLESLREDERRELESLDNRRDAINDFYDEQLDQIDEQEYSKERKELVDEIAKYEYSTSKEGQEKLKELRDRLQRLENDKLRRDLRDKKDAEMRNLDDRKRQIEDYYDDVERNIEDEKDRELDSIEERRDTIVSYYNDLQNSFENYADNIESIEKLLQDKRLNLFKSTNDEIIDSVRNFIDEYERVTDTNISNNDSSSASRSGNAGTSSGSNSNNRVILGYDTDGIPYGENFYGDKSGYWNNFGEFIEYHTGGIAGMKKFQSGSSLLPNEISTILQRGEYVFQPQQLDSLLSAVGGKGGNTYNYNAPLVEHNGDVRLDDDADVSTYWREREIAAQRLLAGGDR